MRGPLSWFRKRRRESTRAEIERLLERDCAGRSDLDKLRWLLGRIFRDSTRSNRSMIMRARRRGVDSDVVERLRAGDGVADATWDQIEVVLRACGASHAAIDVVRDLFRDVRPAGPRLDPAATGGAEPPEPSEPPESPEPPTAPTRPEPWTGQHCSVLLTDVVDFGASTRTDQDRKIIREVMYRIVRDAFTNADISWDTCHHEDRGDGILIVIPPRVPTIRIVHPLVSHIIGELSQHNAPAEDGTSFQLRVALDVGPVESDDEGVTGKVIIDVARLIDAPAFKQKLANAPAETCLGFVTSGSVYDSIIRQQPGQLPPATYQKINPRVKGGRMTAWVKLAPDPGAVSGQHPDA